MTPMMWLVIALVLAASELVTGNFVMLMLAAAAGIVAISARHYLADRIIWRSVRKPDGSLVSSSPKSVEARVKSGKHRYEALAGS